MSLPPRNSNHRPPKRPRFPPPVPEEDEEEEEDYNDHSPATIAYEEDEDEEDYTDESEQMRGGDDEEEDVDVEVEVADDVGVTRMATIGNDLEDTVTEAQSRRPVSSSPSSSSSPLSIRLKSSEVFDCPTCCEPLKGPIYQCNNGHLACSLCCTKLKKKCAFCMLPIGDIRCRAMEKVIEASVVICRNAIYRCQHTLPYGNQSKHEKRCMFAPCFCPLPNCNYKGAYMDVQTHASDSHSWDAENLIPFVFDIPQIFSMNLAKKKRTVFQAEDEGELVVVQAFKGTHGGVCVTVSCIMPMSPDSSRLSCSLAKLNAYTTLRIGLRVKKIQKVREQEEPKEDFLFIPDYMLSGDHLKMQICIGSEFKYVHI